MKLISSFPVRHPRDHASPASKPLILVGDLLSFADEFVRFRAVRESFVAEDAFAVDEECRGAVAEFDVDLQLHRHAISRAGA